MRILVTGGGGYIGSVLVPKLLDHGHEVDVVELFWFGNHLPGEAGIIRKDVLDIRTEELSGYDQVIFLAGLSSDPMAEFAPQKSFILNTAAPAYFASAAKKAGVKRFIYASTCSVYGCTGGRMFDETHPVTSSYAYGISKLAGEQAVLSLADSKFSVITMRKGTVSGYSPRMRLDLMVNTMFMTAMRDQAIVVNNPCIWRPIMSIKDATNAYLCAVNADQPVSGAFNIAARNCTINEIANAVRKVIGGLSVRVMHIPDLRDYQVSMRKANEVLGFHPTDGVKEIVDDLAKNLSKFQDWENPSYYNLVTLKRVMEQESKENECRPLYAS